MDEIRDRLWQEGKDVWQRLHGQSFFVTGGTGFFGRTLLDLFQNFSDRHKFEIDLHLLSRNPERFRSQHADLENAKWLHWHTGEIESFAFPNISVGAILHMATPVDVKMNREQPKQMFDDIVNGTRRVLEVAAQRGIGKILLTSSGAVYGRQPPEVTHIAESFDGDPASDAYGRGKQAAERMGLESGLDFKIARCFSFCGPHLNPDGTYAVGNFIRDAVAGREIVVQGDGTPFRSYLHSDDLILWLFKILLDGPSGRPYNVGSDQDLSIADLAKTVGRVVDPKIGVRIVHPPIGAAPSRYVPSIQRARKELNLQPWTSLETSILHTAKSYKSR